MHFTLSYSVVGDKATQYFNGAHVFNLLTGLVQPVRKSVILDVTGMYQINEKTSISATMPIVFNTYNFYSNYGLFELPDASMPLPLAPRNYTHANDIGDTSIVLRRTIFKPEASRTWNATVGVGIVLPTGNYKARGRFSDYDGGAPIIQKPVFKSIQPGQGGTGIYLEGQAYKNVSFPVRGTTLWGFGSYLLEPHGLNGTSSTNATLWDDPGFLFSTKKVLQNGTTDMYTVRWGAFLPIPNSGEKRYLRGLRIFLGGRMSGVPQHNFIGSSAGYKQPGMIIGAEPGLSYSLGRYSATMTTPIYFYRRSMNDPNQANFDGIAGAGYFQNLLPIPRWQLCLQMARTF